METWRKLGFFVSPRTVRHAPGKRNGFVYIGSVYLEFQWVENEREFKKRQSLREVHLRRHPSPYGVAFSGSNLKKIHSKLKRKGYKVGPIWSKAPDKAPESEPAWWSFQSLTQDHLPGVWSFILTYHVKRKSKKERDGRVGKNGLRKITGITFVSPFARRRAEKWARFFSVPLLCMRPGSYRVKAAHSEFFWMTPQQYMQAYGVRKAKRDSQEIALVHVRASSIHTARKFFERQKKKIRKMGEEAFVVTPSTKDGFTLLVSEGSPA